VASRRIELATRRDVRFREVPDDFTLDDVRALVKALAGTDVTAFHWQRSGQRVVIGRGSHRSTDVVRAAPAPSPVADPGVEAGDAATAPAERPPLAAAHAPKDAETKPGVLVMTPFVGTFYRSPSPDSAPFVEVGAVVKKGQVLCIVEAMKLMNEIEAEVGGRVAEILVQNASPIDLGQALFRIEPT